MSPRGTKNPPAPPADETPVITDEAKLAAVTKSIHDSENLTTEDLAILAGLDEKELAKFAKAVAEADEVASINGFEIASQEFRAETTPQRMRTPRQQAMDAVALRAYQSWVAADRPTQWAKIPVITYFLDADAVEDRKRLIRRACDSGLPPGTSEHGTRVRFGSTFVLSDKMANKIDKPDEAGKTVLPWACVDRNPRPATEGAPPASQDGQSDSDDDED